MVDEDSAAQAGCRELLVALQAGRASDADAALARLEAVAPQHPRTRYARGLLQLARGDAAAAHADLAAAADALPDDLALQSNHALCLQELGRHAAAIEVFDRVLAGPAIHANGHYNRAISLAALGRVDAAIADWRRAVELHPAHAQAWARLADVLHGARRGAEATLACERALQLRPQHAASRALQALLALQRDDVAVAADAAEQATQSDPALFAAWYALGAARHRQQRPELACAALDRALALQPDAPEALKLRGLARQAAHRLEDATHDVLAAARLRFAPGPHRDALPDELRLTSRAKLRHDVEQLESLQARGLLPTVDRLLDAHRSVLEDLPPGLTDARVFELTPNQLGRLDGGYNRLHYLAPAPRLAGRALAPGFDGAALMRDYAARDPGIACIDGVLSDAALRSLRRFCLDSTFWFDCRHAGGYLGAFFENGFAAPLLEQIAEELRAAAPAIFADHPLVQLWAFKYDQQLDGIELHADIAAVNVNFWITPDEANLEPEGGGLLVWDRKAPADWGLDEFNTSDPAGQQRIQDFLAGDQARCVRVPYRCNRAVVFNSDLFHRTDRVRFAPGYENRRINVTMLFGRRAGRLR